MIEALILDLGGVVASNAPRLFLREFAVKNNLTIESVVPAFKKGFPDWILGKMSEEEFWKGFLSELNLPVREDAFVKECGEQLRLFSVMNQDLLLFMEDLEGVNVKVGLASNCPKELGEYIEEKYELGKLFEAVLFSGAEKMGKPDKKFFEKAAKDLGVTVDKSVYVDDKEKNVEAAKEAGMEAILFKDVPKLVEELESYINLTEEKNDKRKRS